MCGVFAVKVYGITASGGDPERRQLEQKVMLANSVAQSFMSADNVNSRGQRMFLLRRQKSEKWTTSGPDPSPDVQQDAGPWPQKAPAGRQQYVSPQPPVGQPRLPVRQQSVPQHHLPSGPRLGRSISTEGLTASQRHQVQGPPRVAAPGPQQHGFLTAGQAASQHLRGQLPRGPAPQGFLRPARPPGPMPVQDRTGAPVQQVRHRSESFGSLPADVRPTPSDRPFIGPGQQHPQQTRHWPASPPSSSQSLIQRGLVHSHYGVSDL